MEQLLAMSKDTHPKLDHDKIDEILAHFVPQVTPGDNDEENR